MSSLSSGRAYEIVSRARITEVWQALGGDSPKFGRAPAFWRKTRDRNVGLNDDKGGWYDFAHNEGGGVLDLIQHVRGGSRKEALEWLAGLLCIPLDDRPLTEAQKRQYARQRAAAEREAGELIAWRDGLVRALEEYRDSVLQAYHRARLYIGEHGLESRMSNLTADVADTYEARYQELDGKLDRLRVANFATLLPYFRASDRRAAA